ncbi:MAG: ABC transporter ATP-binding protein, partial [Oscillospiraceae bacterium]
MPHGNKPMIGSKVQNPKSTIKRILKYVGEYKWQLVIVFIAIMISSASGIIGTYLLKPIINDYITPFIGQNNPDLSGLLGIVTVMAIVYVFGAFSGWLYARLMINVAIGTLYKIRCDLFAHLQKLPIKYFDTHPHGEIMSRFTNDSDTLRDMLSQSLVQMVSSLITVMGVFVMMIIISPVLTILVVLTLIVMMLAIKKIGGKSSKFYKEQQRDMGAVNGYIEEMIEGQKVVKVFCHEDESKKAFDKLNEKLQGSATKANTFANILMPIMGNLSHISYAVTAIVGAILAVVGGNSDVGIWAISIGSLVSFLQFTRSFSQPISQMSQQVNVILSALAGAERIFGLIDEEVEVDDGYVTLVNAKIIDGVITEAPKHTGVWAWKHPHHDGTITYTEVKGAVEFEDVEFGYEPNKTVLRGITLYADPGEKIAFVGSTGAGKTTITNLINRFYDVPDGKIRYDKININKIKKDDLRRSLSMVLQDTHLFTGTVMENIRYGNLTASDEDVIAAARLANADWFVKHLPQGYDTELTADGTNLSQGQRQLL